MKNEFFEKILNAEEGRPFNTTVSSNGDEFDTIAQISEGEEGELNVTLQSYIGPFLDSNDTETTMILPTLPRFRLDPSSYDITSDKTGRKVPLYLGGGPQVLGPGIEHQRVIDGRNISLAEPVRAKTLTLWYEGIWAEDWRTNSDKQQVTISHEDFAVSKVPPHGTNNFFIEITKPTPGKPSIEWDISDTFQGVIVRTDKGKPFVKVAIAPANGRDITWGDYIARIEAKHEDLEIKDIVLHIWRTDESEMDLEAITALEKTISYSLSFMNSAWCRPKVAIAWRETWSDSVWRGTWVPVWGAWQTTRPTKQDRNKNWMPIVTNAEKVLEQVLRNIRKDHHPVIERYVHNTMALDRGDWTSSVTASVAILQRLAIDSGFRIERRGLELWDGIAKYLRSKAVERPYYYIGWGEEARHLIEMGEPHDHLVKAITELRNRVTAHWVNEPSDNASWLGQQAVYYVESALHAELAPKVPMWDRTRASHHPPKSDPSEEIEK